MRQFCLVRFTHKPNIVQDILRFMQSCGKALFVLGLDKTGNNFTSEMAISTLGLQLLLGSFGFTHLLVHILRNLNNCQFLTFSVLVPRRPSFKGLSKNADIVISTAYILVMFEKFYDIKTL